jgi:hypothetical protein
MLTSLCSVQALRSDTCTWRTPSWRTVPGSAGETKREYQSNLIYSSEARFVSIRLSAHSTPLSIERVATRNLEGKIRDFDNSIAKKGRQKISVYNQHPPQVEPGTSLKTLYPPDKLYHLERAYYVTLSNRPKTAI